MTKPSQPTGQRVSEQSVYGRGAGADPLHGAANPDNPVWDTSGGNSTRDRIFLFSVEKVISHYSFNSYYEEFNQ